MGAPTRSPAAHRPSTATDDATPCKRATAHRNPGTHPPAKSWPAPCPTTAAHPDSRQPHPAKRILHPLPLTLRLLSRQSPLATPPIPLYTAQNLNTAA